jgi:superfamily II DNA or RNA helicase
MLQLPTGAGKTVIAANIIRRARAKGKRVAFAVSALSLIDQTVAAFEAEGTVSDMAGFHGELKWFAHERGQVPGKVRSVAGRLASQIRSR